MSTVIPEDRFTKKLIQKKFDDLYFKYITRSSCELEFYSLVTICSEHKVKIVEYMREVSGYMDNCAVDIERFLDCVSQMEWDYEFITDSLLRISISSSVWYDIYFTSSLSEDTKERYLDLMEREVLNNYTRMDDYMLSSRMMFDELAEMQENFYETYGEELLPSFFTS